jgi:iron(III) transport system ATP-binding protein
MSTTSAPELLRIERLQVRFGDVQAVSGADLQLAEGEIIALLGPSGCGKTTLLRAVAGFERASEGKILLDGEVIESARRSVAAHQRPVGMVFQDYALFPHRTVAGNVGYGLGRTPWGFGGGRREHAARVRTLLAMAGLEGLEGRYPHQLSGGQQQRVALLRSLAPRPRVLLLDEPFSNLDPMRRHEIRSQVAALIRAEGVSAILVTHDRADALALADRVALMAEGRILEAGPPADLYFRPGSEAAAELLGDVQYLDAEVREGVALTPLGTLHPVGPVFDGPCRLLIRPEWIVPCVGGVSCEISGQRLEGAVTRLSLRVPGGRLLEMAAPSGWTGAQGGVLSVGVSVAPPSFRKGADAERGGGPGLTKRGA